MLYHVISCYIMLYHVISCYIMLHHVISCYIMLYPNKDGVYNQAEPIVKGAPYPKKHGGVPKPSISSETFEPFHHTFITHTHGLYIHPTTVIWWHQNASNMAGWKASQHKSPFSSGMFRLFAHTFPLIGHFPATFDAVRRSRNVDSLSSPGLQQPKAILAMLVSLVWGCIGVESKCHKPSPSHHHLNGLSGALFLEVPVMVGLWQPGFPSKKKRQGLHVVFRYNRGDAHLYSSKPVLAWTEGYQVFDPVYPFQIETWQARHDGCGKVYPHLGPIEWVKW